jgi:hypothetical protein
VQQGYFAHVGLRGGANISSLIRACNGGASCFKIGGVGVRGGWMH